MQLQKAIKERRSIRKYKTKSVDWRPIIEAIDSARLAPMAGNIYTPKFILISDEKIIEKLAEAAQQQFIQNAKYVVVVCSNPKLLITSYEERGKNYNKQQVGAAIQNFLLTLTEKKLATCWVGHFVDYLVKEAVGIPDGIEVEAMFPIGHELPSKIQRKRAKPTLDNLLYFNKWKNKKMEKHRKVNV